MIHLESSPQTFMWVYYFFSALLTLQAIISLRGGAHYLSYIRRETGAEKPAFTPSVSLIVPCRGLEQGLRENLNALFHQEYPSYEIIFVSDREDDQAIPVFETTQREASGTSHVRSRVIIAGEATDSGQKVHNLRVAVREVDSTSQVFVFVDSDARPRTHWLRSLVGPLADEGLGATTGYRWFIPELGRFASVLRAVWNASIASALGPRGDRNFCWGGSTAIRREIFESAGIMDEWRGAASDDFAIMRALRREGLPIHFVPDCLTVSHDDCTFGELMEFSTRQLKITRVYAPQFWQTVLFSNLLFVLVFFGGLSLVLARAALGLSFAVPLVFIGVIYFLGTLKAYVRWRAVGIPLAEYSRELRRDALAHLMLWPLASVLYLFNAVAALVSRRIKWRGISYQLKSPHETVIIRRQKEKRKRKK